MTETFRDINYARNFLYNYSKKGKISSETACNTLDMSPSVEEVREFIEKNKGNKRFVHFEFILELKHRKYPHEWIIEEFSGLAKAN